MSSDPVSSDPVSSIDVLPSIAPLAAGRDVWFVDIWGVLHNGVRPFVKAVAACRLFRAQGGYVILVSNSPRPRDGVVKQLDGVGIARDAYDAIITSGDVSRRMIAAYAGQTVFHLGPARDLPVFDGTDAVLGSAADATAVVCTGLFDDEHETALDYGSLLSGFKDRGLEMICVNPDIKAERGGRIIYCAGALAEAYETLGGAVRYAGKPFAPIYDEAFAIAKGLAGQTLSISRVLAIGDGVKTDIAGALKAGFDAVYVASGVHVESGETIASAAARLFPDPSFRPIAVMTALAW